MTPAGSNPTTRLIPRNGLVVVRPIKAREIKSSHGIILPASCGDVFEMAEIVAVGPGVWDAGKYIGTEDLKPGMTVMVKSGVQLDISRKMQSYVNITEGGEELRLLNQQDIFAVVDVAPLCLVGRTDAAPAAAEHNGGW